MTFLRKVTFLAYKFDLSTNLNFIFGGWLKVRNINRGYLSISGSNSEGLSVILLDAILNHLHSKFKDDGDHHDFEYTQYLQFSWDKYRYGTLV